MDSKESRDSSLGLPSPLGVVLSGYAELIALRVVPGMHFRPFTSALDLSWNTDKSDEPIYVPAR